MAKIVFFLSSLFSFICVCLGKLELRNVINYKGMKYSHYAPWNLRGELTFVFKTSQRNGLLAYQDDGKNSFVEVFIVDGNVRVKACIGGCEGDPKEVFIREHFADGFWHKLRIKRQPRNCTITVDDNIARVPCGDAQDNRFKYYNNYLYVANFNPMVSLNNLVFPGAFHEGLYYRFQGCIGDIRYSHYKGKLIDAVLKETTGDSGCISACATPNVNQCQNKGQCVDELGHVVCDCLATGYEGQLCSKLSSSVYLNGSGYMVYDVGTHQSGRSTAANNIAFRFATSNPSGVVLLTDIGDDHVIVELVNGFLRVSWDLGQGGLVLMSRQGCLHDAVWHSVTISRLQRRIKITIDDQRPIHAAIPGKLSDLDFKGGSEQMFFGGGPLTKAFNRSISRANFTGFLQQFQFDEFDVIDEAILGKTFTLLGNGRINASSLFHLIPSSPSPLANCSREVDPERERLCEENDDEDLCGSSAVTSGDGPLVPDCENTGSCGSALPDHQQSTDSPLLMNVSSNKNLSSLNVTSLNMTSQIHPSPSRSGNVTKTLEANKTVSSTSYSTSSSLSVSKTTSQSIPTTANFDVQPTSTISTRKNTRVYTEYRMTSSSTISSVNTEITKTNQTKTLKPSPTRPRSTKVTGSSVSVGNSTVLAYRNDVSKHTGSPLWLGGILIAKLLWCF